nr:PREDICTED: clavesin-1-like [Bemisia tabaci]XP_018903882.1 PREDICTED: clavesin-1-like [Bemisia tabaci]
MVKYDCPFDKSTQEEAEKELRETSEIRESALEKIQEWIEKNPRIETCRTDPNFLLRFLRTKKFSMMQAQEALERYLLLRQTYGSMMFLKLDVQEPRMQELLDEGYLFAVPGRDKYGRRIIIARPGAFDMDKYANTDMCRIHGVTYETLMEDEENQVRGYVHFCDGAGVAVRMLSLFTPKEAVRIVKNGERTLPMRHKEVHVINVHPSVKFAMDFAMTLVSEKIRKRVKLHSNVEEVHEHIDKSLLPKEYGGTIPMAEMIESWKKELLAKREMLLSNDDMRVREDLFSEGARQGAVSALRGGCGPQNDIMAGSFRKLAID